MIRYTKPLTASLTVVKEPLMPDSPRSRKSEYNKSSTDPPTIVIPVGWAIQKISMTVAMWKEVKSYVSCASIDDKYRRQNAVSL